MPALYSLKALQTQEPYSDTLYLTYWTVFGFFTVLEGLADVVLYWFPFYYTFKTIFLLWLALPQTQGAKVIYANILRPLAFGTPKGQLPKGYYSSSPSTLSGSTPAAASSTASKVATPSAASSTAIPATSTTGSASSATSRAVPTSTSTAAPTSTLPSMAAPTSTSTSAAAPSIPSRASPPTSTSAIPPIPPRGSPTSATKASTTKPAAIPTAAGATGLAAGATGASALSSPPSLGSSLPSTSAPLAAPLSSTYDYPSGLDTTSPLSGATKSATPGVGATPTSTGVTPGVGAAPSSAGVTPGVGATPTSASSAEANPYGTYGDRFHAEQAIKAAQKAQALDGVDGHVPSDLEKTVDALAKGDFAKADKLNPFA